MHDRLWLRLLLIACAFSLSPPAAPQTPLSPVRYQLEPQVSSVVFALQTIGNTHLRMHFGRITAELDQSPENGPMPHVAVTIDAKSVNASTPFAAHFVRSRAVLDVERYPQIRFSSTSFTRTGIDTGLLTGDLTIREVTKPVTLAVQFERSAAAAGEPADSLAFSAGGHFSRTMFGIASWPTTIGDDVEMSIRVEFSRMAPGG